MSKTRPSGYAMASGSSFYFSFILRCGSHNFEIAERARMEMNYNFIIMNVNGREKLASLFIAFSRSRTRPDMSMVRLTSESYGGGRAKPRKQEISIEFHC
jgi:hypothetical protein